MIRRGLLTFLSALSLILCLATVVLSVDADSQSRAIRPRTDTMLRLSHGRSGIRFGWVVRTACPSSNNGSIRRTVGVRLDRFWRPQIVSNFTGSDLIAESGSCVRVDRRLLEFAIYSVSYGPSNVFFLTRGVTKLGEIEVPYWPVWLVPVGLVWTRIMQGVRRRWLTIRGLCPACGYELRATPRRCAECGRASLEGGAQQPI